MNEIKPSFKDIKDYEIYIITSEFNSFITKELLNGALECFREFNLNEKNITTVWVPGAFEHPLMAKMIAEEKRPDGIICLGAVIKGGTAHFDYVAGQNASGMMSVSLSTGIPIMNGVLTTENTEQAIDRAGVKMGNKGYDCALALLKMLSVKGQLFQ